MANVSLSVKNWKKNFTNFVSSSSMQSHMKTNQRPKSDFNINIRWELNSHKQSQIFSFDPRISLFFLIEKRAKKDPLQFNNQLQKNSNKQQIFLHKLMENVDQTNIITELFLFRIFLTLSLNLDTSDKNEGIFLPLISPFSQKIIFGSKYFLHLPAHNPSLGALISYSRLLLPVGMPPIMYPADFCFLSCPLASLFLESG